MAGFRRVTGQLGVDDERRFDVGRLRQIAFLLSARPGRSPDTADLVDGAGGVDR